MDTQNTQNTQTLADVKQLLAKHGILFSRYGHFLFRNSTDADAEREARTVFRIMNENGYALQAFSDSTFNKQRFSLKGANSVMLQRLGPKLRIMYAGVRQ